MKPLKRIFGIFLFLIGIILISGSQTGITGNIISETASAFVNIFGLVLVVVGVLLMTETLEEKVEASEELSPEEEKEIVERLNEKVESGEWVELGIITVRATNNPVMYPQGTSLCRYWGDRKYLGATNRALKKLYEEGEIGKTHEIARGSDKYKIGGSLSKGDVSIPPKASKILHRHWETDQIYKFLKENKKY